MNGGAHKPNSRSLNLHITRISMKFFQKKRSKNVASDQSVSSTTMSNKSSKSFLSRKPSRASKKLLSESDVVVSSHSSVVVVPDDEPITSSPSMHKVPSLTVLSEKNSIEKTNDSCKDPDIETRVMGTLDTRGETEDQRDLESLVSDEEKNAREIFEDTSIGSVIPQAQSTLEMVSSYISSMWNVETPRDALGYVEIPLRKIRSSPSSIGKTLLRIETLQEYDLAKSKSLPSHLQLKGMDSKIESDNIFIDNANTVNKSLKVADKALDKTHDEDSKEKVFLNTIDGAANVEHTIDGLVNNEGTIDGAVNNENADKSQNIVNQADSLPRKLSSKKVAFLGHADVSKINPVDGVVDDDKGYDTNQEIKNLVCFLDKKTADLGEGVVRMVEKIAGDKIFPGNGTVTDTLDSTTVFTAEDTLDANTVTPAPGSFDAMNTEVSRNGKYQYEIVKVRCSDNNIKVACNVMECVDDTLKGCGNATVQNECETVEARDGPSVATGLSEKETHGLDWYNCGRIDGIDDDFLDVQTEFETVPIIEESIKGGRRIGQRQCGAIDSLQDGIVETGKAIIKPFEDFYTEYGVEVIARGI